MGRYVHTLLEDSVASSRTLCGLQWWLGRRCGGPGRRFEWAAILRNDVRTDGVRRMQGRRIERLSRVHRPLQPFFQRRLLR